jgi:hypothetical protein
MCIGMAGAHEPGLQQRIAGSQCEKWQTDRNREETEKPKRGNVGHGWRAPALCDSKRERQRGQEQKRNMNCDRHIALPQGCEHMCVGIAGEQHRLKKDQCNGPHRWRAAQTRQHHAREHRLHAKQQQRAQENRGGVDGECESVRPRLRAPC